MQIHPKEQSPAPTPLWSPNAAVQEAALERIHETNAMCLDAMKEAALSWSGLVGQMLGSGNPWQATSLYVQWLGDRTQEFTKTGQELGRVWLGSFGAPSSGEPAEKLSRPKNAHAAARGSQHRPTEG